MAKQIWSANLIVTTDNGERRDDSFSFHHDDLVADGLDEAKNNIFAWAHKKLARFTKRSGRSVQIHAGPHINGGLDGTKMLRNRFKFGSIKSFMKKGVTAEKVFVVGYGPKEAEELTK